MSIRHFLSLTILSLLTVCPLRADEDTVDSAYILQDVVVKGNRRAEVIPSRTLEGERLRNLSSHSVADALRFFSGVQLKDYGGVSGIKTINIRSMGSQHTGVYLDGIQLGNAQNGQIDLGRYDLGDIEEISIFNGNKSNIFQGARDFGSAGAIYIRSRHPRWRGDERFHLRAGLRGGAFGLVQPDLSIDWRLSRSVSLTASAAFTSANGRYRFRYRRLNRDGSVAYDTTATRHNGDIRAIRANAALNGYTLRGSWMAKVYAYDSDRGIPGAIVNNVFRNGERQHDRSFMVQGRTEQLLSSRYNLMVAAKWSHDYLHYLRDDPRELYINNVYRQQEAYVSTANLFKVNDRLSLNGSVDLQFNTMSSNMADFLNPRRFTVMGAVAAALTFDRLSLQASGLLTSAADRTGNDRTNGRSTRWRTIFTPAVFANWSPLADCPDWHVTAFVKESWRLPTFNDLYYTEIGNKDLRPERTWQFDIGTNRSFRFNGPLSALSLGLEAYHNRVDDKIIAYPAGQQFRWTMLNLGRVAIFGVEANVNASARIKNVALTGLLTYTYQSARDITDHTDPFYGDQIPYIPHHSGSATLSAEWRGWQLNYAFIYTGRRWSAQENTPSNLEQPWYTSDASLFKSFAVRAVRCRAGLELNNVFGQDYEVIRNYPMPGRSLMASLKIEY